MEATFKGATSAWMMALLLDPLFHYWTLNWRSTRRQDGRQVVRFSQPAGMLPDGSKAYYVINCFARFNPKESRGEFGPDMEMHNAEIAYTFALGSFFTDDHARP